LPHILGPTRRTRGNYDALLRWSGRGFFCLKAICNNSSPTFIILIKTY
jgi:hypothetical protein